MFKKLTFLSAAAMSLALAVPAQAQWVNFPTPNNSGEYWDNPSSDDVGGPNNCNIGFIVRGMTAAADCNNQRPANWLPGNFPADPFELYHTSALFSYAGAAGVSISYTQLNQGDIAGQNRDWGVWTQIGAAPRVLTNFNTGAAAPILTNPLLTWGLWVSTTDGITRYSDTDAQFARFAQACASPGGVCGPVIVGIEDISVAGVGSDRDYNDMIASFTLVGVNLECVGNCTPSVPEPSTYALMAAGLAALGLVARRRRRNA